MDLYGLQHKEREIGETGILDRFWMAREVPPPCRGVLSLDQGSLERDPGAGQRTGQALGRVDQQARAIVGQYILGMYRQCREKKERRAIKAGRHLHQRHIGSAATRDGALHQGPERSGKGAAHRSPYELNGTVFVGHCVAS